MNLALSMPILAAGLLLAAAAPVQPGPDALPAQVAGVLGSGDQLSLQLRPTSDSPGRVVHLGEEAIDGWTLSGLTDSVATLSKNGAVRAIGLNPTGALAQPRPAGPPSMVRVAVEGLTPDMAATLALSDEEVLARASPAARQGYQAMAAARGLTVEEGRRLALYQLRMGLMSATIRDAAQARARAALDHGIRAGSIFGMDQVAAVLFGQDYVDLVGKQRQYDYQQAQLQYQRAVADGFTMVWVPMGQRLTAYPGGMVEAGYSAQGFLFVVQPPVQPAPADQPYRSAPVPTLTADMLGGLTDPGGSPAGSAAQAAALAANQQFLKSIASDNARSAAITYYGPFGVVPSPMR